MNLKDKILLQQQVIVESNEIDNKLGTVFFYGCFKTHAKYKKIAETFGDDKEKMVAKYWIESLIDCYLVDDKKIDYFDSNKFLKHKKKIENFIEKFKNNVDKNV